MLALLAVAGVALMGLFPARPAWLINAWSLQYARHALIPAPSRADLELWWAKMRDEPIFPDTV